MAAHQAPPSLGFSRQEHWSGLPFPSPMNESEKWKGSCSVLSDSSQPHGLQPTRLLPPWDFPGKNTGVGCHRLLCVWYLAVAAKSLQLCPTLCDSVDGRQPTRLPHPWDSPGKNTGVDCHFLLQWMKVKVKSLSRVRLFATPWTAAHQGPLSMGFSRQEYWSGVPLPSPEVVFSVELILLHYCETLSTLLFIPWIVCVFLIWLMGTGSVFSFSVVILLLKALKLIFITF